MSDANGPAPPGSDYVAVRLLPHGVQACSIARIWVREQLSSLAVKKTVVDDVVLCLDELVANVAIHTLSAPEVTITVGEQILVEVADSSSEPAAIQVRPGEPGRWGLRIVDNIAASWGSRPHGSGGKTVWFTIAT